jgi:hypothetical protein
MNIISEWLSQMLPYPQQDYVDYPLSQVVFLNNLNKCVHVKEAPLRSNDLRIVSCEESYIYIDAPVDYLLIANCTNCTIFAAAVAKCCSIDKCEGTTVTVAAHCLRIGNCVDCSVYSYT